MGWHRHKSAVSGLHLGPRSFRDSSQAVRARASHGWRLGAAASILAAITVSLAGCLPSSPDFTTPMAWRGGSRQVAAESASVTTSVQLLDGQRATLVDFPQGVTRELDGGYVCLDLSTEERYTGEATWSNRNGYSIVLTFGESSIVVSSDAARFGGQDWSVLRLHECTSDAYWYLQYFCGESGYGDTTGPYRHPCPADVKLD